MVSRSLQKRQSFTAKQSGTRRCLTHFTNPVILVSRLLALCIATLATNRRRQRGQPSQRFLARRCRTKFLLRTGGLITGIVGIVMMPWKLVADPSGYIFTWLVGYSAVLGPIGGIMIADYYVLPAQTTSSRRTLSGR